MCTLTEQDNIMCRATRLAACMDACQDYRSSIQSLQRGYLSKVDPRTERVNVV